MSVKEIINTLYHYCQLWSLYMNGLETSYRYSLIERRLVYLRKYQSELLKKKFGIVYSEELINACIEYLKTSPKPRISIKAISRRVEEDSVAQDVQ